MYVGDPERFVHLPAERAATDDPPSAGEIGRGLVGCYVWSGDGSSSCDGSPASSRVVADTNIATRRSSMNADRSRQRTDERDDTEVVEPDNSTVDDWLGQRVGRDTELAEKIAGETGDPEVASRRFEDEKEGSRPEDLPTKERP